MTDPWAAFGEEDDEEEDTGSADNTAKSPLNVSCRDQQDAAIAVSNALIHRWVNQGGAVSLRHRQILLVVNSNSIDNENFTETSCWKDVLLLKSIPDVSVQSASAMHTIDTDQATDDSMRSYDAIICLLSSSTSQIHMDSLHHSSLIKTCESILIPGGYLILPGDVLQTERSHHVFSNAVWDVTSFAIITSPKDSSDISWTLLPKWSCGVDHESCKWLSTKHSLSDERRLLSTATISLSVHERENGYLSPTLLNKAVLSIRQHGYCIVSGLLHNERNLCVEYGSAALADVQAASKILQQQHGIDLYEPSLSVQEPGIYRELSMREDCRMDIRHGPALDALRGPTGGTSITYQAADQGDATVFLRGNRNILSIVRRAMNPTASKDRSAGNYGRYNFEGRGPDGSDRDLVCGPVGAIVNLPGSGDQAIHADTPHLFEHVIDPSPLPPHYINVFTLGCPATERVGQTAFIHGSHSMEFVANHIRSESTNDDSRDPFLPSVWKNLVRPRMELGDVAIFDCRILHFGLSNRHASMARPMIYSNMTLHWFNDPKNWDEHTSIFNDVVQDTNASP